MGYSQSKKLSQTEKKLQSLKLQLYGKPENLMSLTTEKPKSTHSAINQSSDTLVSSGAIKNNDPHFLKKDLTKIFLLAILAISIELTIYFTNSYGLLKF